jgi:hypothetical protein
MLRLPEKNPKKTAESHAVRSWALPAPHISHRALEIFTPATGHLV